MSIKSMRLTLVSTFLVSYQSESASLVALVKQRSQRGHHSMPQLIYEPMVACYKELRHLSYPVLRGGTRRLHDIQCNLKSGPKANVCTLGRAISRGGVIHTSS